MIIDLSNLGGGGGQYVLPVASESTLGGVKINGNGLSIDSAGTLSAATQEIGVATTATTGVVKIGSGITVDSAGTISVESQGGDATVLESVSSLPTGATNGDVMANFQSGYVQSLGYVSYNNVPQEKTFNYDPSDYQYFYFVRGSKTPTKKTLLFHFEAWGWNNIYINTDGTYSFSGENIQETVIPESGFTFDDGDWMTFLPYQGGLRMQFSFGREIYPDYYIEEGYKFDGNMWTWNPNSGSSVCIKEFVIGEHKKNIVIAYYGELPTNQILFVFDHTAYWENEYNYIWLADDGYFWIAGNTGKTNGERMFTFGETKDYSYFYRITASDGVISIAVRELGGLKVSTYEDWDKFNGGHFEPTGWVEKCKNLVQYAYKYPFAHFTINGQTTKYAGERDFDGIVAPTEWGTKGKVLVSQGHYQVPVWGDYGNLVFCPDGLPSYTTKDDGTIFIETDSTIGYPSTAYLTKSSTSSSDKNNINTEEEIWWYDWGNNYIYYNRGDDTATGDTLLYVIKIRTQEDSDWNSNNVKDIYVYKCYDDDDAFNDGYFFKIKYDFEISDGQGGSEQYSDELHLGNEGDNEDIYLPVWNSDYGYCFHFEIPMSRSLPTQAKELYMWMRHSDVDNEQDGSVDDGSYGDVPYRIGYYTKEFYYDIPEEDRALFYVWRGGRFIYLGKALLDGDLINQNQR